MRMKGNTRTKPRFWGINPNFKSSAFRPARITHSNLPAPSASPPPSLPLSCISFYHLSSHLICCVSLRLFFITHCLTIIHSIQSSLFLHSLFFIFYRFQPSPNSPNKSSQLNCLCHVPLTPALSYAACYSATCSITHEKTTTLLSLLEER